MPSINLRFLRQGDPPLWQDATPVGFDMEGNWKAVVIENGMTSGQPAVALLIPTSVGEVIVQTSLLAFLAAATGLKAIAETQFGWTMPPL